MGQASSKYLKRKTNAMSFGFAKQNDVGDIKENLHKLFEPPVYLTLYHDFLIKSQKNLDSGEKVCYNPLSSKKYFELCKEK